MDDETGYLSFWGKTRMLDGAGYSWHPLAYHSLDVAAVAIVLLRDRRLLAVDPTYHAALATLVAWHDLGKFTRPFQAKAKQFWPPVLGEFRATNPAHGHDSAGFGLLNGPLEALRDWLLPGWKAYATGLLRAVCGHHGRPPQSMEHVSFEEACQPCQAAASAFAADAARVIGAEPISRPDLETARRLVWQMAGLTVLADWIGSNEIWFPFDPTPIPLEDYWPQAVARAAKAVVQAGVIPAPVRPDLTLHDLAPHAVVPTPLQAFVQTLEFPAGGPSLIVIEDQTGAGKTEAALLLAHRLMAAGQARGIFIALPTMATANAMYARLATAYRALFAVDADPSLVLAHGKRTLHEGFRKSILWPGDNHILPSQDPADESAEQQCAAWVASDRRRAFLADAGVGTIDQALLAVLPSRHAPLRMVGLARCVLIVDEAHAYDPYMGEELDRLVEFHAALGGSTIILSATLPGARRAGLVKAFQAGARGGAERMCAPEAAYPLVTVVTREAVRELPCAARPELARMVQVERLDGMAAAVARIVAAARAGLAVAWVRNAVDDAIEGFSALQAAGLDVALFHARFAMGDRLEIEAAAMARFGRESRFEGRAGGVLVATQVIEQSLDLDFDLMVSDLAPMDLLIQRAGRLWRHPGRERAPIASEPRLLVLSPEPRPDAGSTWLAGEFRRTRSVYPETVLWRTADTLFKKGQIDTPGDLRGLVEAVYGPDGVVPAGLSAALLREEGEGSGARSMARINLLAWKDLYSPGQGWGPDVQTPTRLSEPTVTFRLATCENGVLVPLCEADTPRLAWALSEVSVAAWRASGVPAPTGALKLAVDAAKRDWGRWEQDIPLLVLSNGEASVTTERGVERRAIYCPATGLSVI